MKYTIICEKCGEKTNSDTYITRCASCQSTDTYVSNLEIGREELLKNIRQEAIEEFRAGLMKEMHENDHLYANYSYDVKCTWRDALRIIVSYNLPIK